MHSPLLARLMPAAALLATLLAGCAYMPSSYSELPWRDAWGDRGAQVRTRDYAMCTDLVEQRRSQLAPCMAARGWQL